MISSTPRDRISEKKKKPESMFDEKIHQQAINYAATAFNVCGKACLAGSAALAQYLMKLQSDLNGHVTRSKESSRDDEN